MLSRRSFVAIAGVSAACLTVATHPAAAHFPGKRSRLLTTTTDLGRRVSGHVFLPNDTFAPAAAVLVLHDNDGVVASLRWFNAEIGRRGFLTVAPNLYETLPLPSMTALDSIQTLDTLVSWLRWQKAHFRSSGKVGVVAFGGGAIWAARAAAIESVGAMVCYCPSLADPAFERVAAQTAMLVHLSTPDQGAEAAHLPKIEHTASTSNHTLAVHWYDTHTGFSNFLGKTFNKESDALALNRTVDFLEKTLR